MKMEFSYKRLQSFPMDGPTSQAILKIIQLECVDMSDPIEIVDLCLHWKNSWRRSKVYWEGLLEQTCERLGVDIPNDRTEALVPENMLPDKSKIAQIYTALKRKRRDIKEIIKSEFQRPKRRNDNSKNVKSTESTRKKANKKRSRVDISKAKKYPTTTTTTTTTTIKKKKKKKVSDTTTTNNTNNNTNDKITCPFCFKIFTKTQGCSTHKRYCKFNPAIADQCMPVNKKNSSSILSGSSITTTTTTTSNNKNNNVKNNKDTSSNNKKKRVRKKRIDKNACQLCHNKKGVNLTCKSCSKKFHSECVGRIVGLIHNVEGWECSECASENELNFGTCFICGKGGSLICCENCPRSFHKRCCGVTSGLEDDRNKKTNQVVDDDKQKDWCKLCKATCPVANDNCNAIDIFSVTTSMRYESERAHIENKAESLEKVSVVDLLRHLELMCSPHFFNELFYEFYKIFHSNKEEKSNKLMEKFMLMIGKREFIQILKFLNDNGTDYANGFSLMGGRSHGWQMCTNPNCNKFRVLRTKCYHCGMTYRKDVVQLSMQNSCERFLFIPVMPKQTKVLINILIPKRDQSTFANEKKKSIKRALDRLMDVTMEKHKVANRTPNPTPNITDLGSIVFLHYQAYVNLKDINLIRIAKTNFIKAAEMWLESSVIFVREDDEDASEEYEESIAKIAAVLLDCTQGLCALRWAMTAKVISPCKKHGNDCPFCKLSISGNSRPYKYKNVASKEASKCPYERALQLEYNLSMIDEGELYNDCTSWEYPDRYPITPKGHCMRCDKKYSGRPPSDFICCDDKPLLRTIDYSTCYDYLIWGYCTQIIGIDAFKFDLKRFVKKLPVIRSYGTFEELGHRIYLHQCYFITHYIYVMSDWGRHRLCLNKFWEEFAFIVDNIKIVANHLKDFEVLGEFLNCLGIIGIAEEGEEAIQELVQYGQACLLQAERVRYNRNGQWVSRNRALKDQFHSSWCGLVGLTDYPDRAVGTIQRRESPPLRIPPYFLGLNASVGIFGLPKKAGEDGTPIKYELRHKEDKKFSDEFILRENRRNGRWPNDESLDNASDDNGNSNSSSNSMMNLADADGGTAAKSDTSSVTNVSMANFDGISSGFGLPISRANSVSSVISNGSSLRLIGNTRTTSSNNNNSHNRNSNASNFIDDDADDDIIHDNNNDNDVVDDIDGMSHHMNATHDVESDLNQEEVADDENLSEDSMTMMNTIGNGDVDEEHGDAIMEMDDDEDDAGVMDQKEGLSSSATTTTTTTIRRKYDDDNGEKSPSNSSKSSTSYGSSSEEEDNLPGMVGV